MQYIDVVLFDALADWEIGHALAHINSPMWQKQPGRYAVRTASQDGQPVTTMGGLRVAADVSFAALEPEQSALLLLPGGPWQAGETEALEALAVRWLAAGRTVAGVCGATAGLARAGVLNTRAHTSNAVEFLAEQPGYAGAALYRSEPAVSDQGLITASGLFPVHFAAAIFAALDLYPPEVLAAWTGLFTTGDAAHYAVLAAA